MQELICSYDQTPLEKKEVVKETVFRGVDVTAKGPTYVCPVCGLESGNIETGAVWQKKINEAYKKKIGLLTSEEIKTLRKQRGLNQTDFAALIGVGEASIKRWEAGMIQSKSMDDLMRMHFKNNIGNGNRDFSASRILLTIRAFEKALKKNIFPDESRMIYPVKYLFFADMTAFRELGRSITGATYASMKHGPQINNYAEQLNEIKNADIADAEPLTDVELNFIHRTVKAFPTEASVYEASHNEPAWKETKIGNLILYDWADKIIADI